MADDPVAGWHRPAMARFRMPVRRFAVEIRKWVAAGRGGRWTGDRHLQAEWLPGGSIAAAAE
jgi:hypothetical protein